MQLRHPQLEWLSQRRLKPSKSTIRLSAEITLFAKGARGFHPTGKSNCEYQLARSKAPKAGGKEQAEPNSDKCLNATRESHKCSSMIFYCTHGQDQASLGPVPERSPLSYSTAKAIVP